MPVPRNNDEWRDHWEIELSQFVSDPRAEFRSFARWYGRWKSRDMLRILNLYLNGDMMARGQGKTKAVASNRNQWTEFVDIPLGEDDFEQIEKAFPDIETTDEAIAELLGEGYRVSLSYNAGNDAFIASVTCKNADDPNNGKTFNAFAGSWVEALQCALYKHYVKARKNWGTNADKPARPRFG